MPGITPALFNARSARPAVMAPSPVTAMGWRLIPALRDATAIPSVAEIEVEECAVPKASYSDSQRRGNPEIPPYWRKPAICERRPVNILWGRSEERRVGKEEYLGVRRNT